MGTFFSFTKKSTESPPLGGAAGTLPPNDPASAGNPIITAARANAQAELQTTSRRRGRPSKDSSSLRSDTSALPPDLQAEIQRQIEGALDPRAWAALLALPADTALAITGREHWKISKDERDTLGATGSAMARAMMIANPKMLCLIMLSSAMFSCYMPRVIKEAEHLKQKRAMKKGDAVKPAPAV